VHVSELWRYPVKSMVGERVDTVELDLLGIVDDRLWATRDLERGGIRGAKKLGGLMTFAARARGDGHAVITLPDDTQVATDHPDVHERVSEALGHRVRLESLRPATDLDHYRRGAPDSSDMMVELREIFGREADEPIPDLSVFPPEIAEFESPPGTYYDAFPLLVMTTAALAALRAALPDSVIDVRRFRPSIMVDTGDAVGHPEFDWTGRTATLGGARIEFGARCPRCVMITRRINDEVDQDRRILRHVVSELGQDVGVYATVVEPGPVAVGDLVTFD
jgi:uncharacterized protein